MKTINQMIERINKPDLGYLVLRIAVGVAFIMAGWSKVTGIEGTVEFFGKIGFASWLAYFVAYAEFIGGIALVLGLSTRFFGLVLAVIMAVAVKITSAKGFDGYPFVLMFTSAAIILFGAGKYSLDALCKNKCGSQIR